MTAFPTILCAVDQSDYSHGTLRRAVHFSRMFHGDVAVLTVKTGQDAPLSRDAVESAVAELVQFVRESTGVTQARAIVVEGRPVREICRVAKERSADLLVVGMHGPPGGFARLILSPATERIVRRAPCPVLVVPRRPSTDAADFAIRKIVCGVDRSPASRRALELALAIAQHVHADLTVVHAIEDIGEEDPKVSSGHFNTPACQREIEPAVHAMYEQLIPADRRRHGNVLVQTPIATAHAELLRVANDKHAELIVLGAIGWRGSLGRTARHVLREARCDVLVVPHNGL